MYFVFQLSVVNQYKIVKRLKLVQVQYSIHKRVAIKTQNWITFNFMH